jgi:hypothetical protein
MSPGSRRGGHAIQDIGARRGLPVLRYKMSQWHNQLVLLIKQTISRGRRYKSSYRRNPLFWWA